MRAIRLKPSPALVVASIALLVALAETSWATVSLVIPRNSVGTLQLKTNAVTSAKIRNASVGLQDLTAAARLPGPVGPPGPAGPAGPAGAAGSVTRLWAVVNASGSIARSAGTTSAGRLGLGAYEVIFNQDVQNCVFVASIGSPDTTTSTGEAATARRSGNVNAVAVVTQDLLGAQADRSFHLIVVC